ncbi:MAG: lysophospholipid acyltransferase family protein [Balneolales bacterium]|nr:lysophospholipid acyltransferase family protein [Balneolales bacterium]
MNDNKGTKDIFSLDVDLPNKTADKLLKLSRGPLEKLIGIGGLNDIYHRAMEMGDPAFFAENILKGMNVDFRISEQDLARIPEKGKVIIVANHPFGGIEGIIMAAILQRVRPDVKIMANYLLSAIPEMRDLFIFVDPFGGQAAARANLASMKQTIGLLNNGEMLGVFPAGEVAHYTLKNRKVTDPKWSNTVAKIIKKTESQVVPMFFSGQNRFMFQLAGLVHPRLRTALLPRELLNKRNTVIEVRIGNAIPFTRLRKFENETDLTNYVRQRTYMLENRPGKVDDDESITFPSNNMKPVIDPVDPELLLTDVESLPPSQMLLESGGTRVYHASIKQIPNIIREIGRLREVTFRATDEGTGESIDLDEFDDYYQHLFVWNVAKNEIIGAYRLGRTDNIIKRFGKKGMYTTTLFNIKSSFFEQVNPALEMGRSFVRPEYQRSFSPLLMLWRGIGHYVAKYPKYKILFGPVSINKEYQSSSRQLMVTFLKMHNYLPELASKVKAITPLRHRKLKGWDNKSSKSIISSVDDLSEVVSDLEFDDKGVPILLKQYLKLGGKLLGFNVDPNFSDVLDGLILVDITKTDPKIMERYMPRDDLARFHDMHKTLFAEELMSNLEKKQALAASED